MTVLCTGLAFLGLCVPLPGHSLKALAAAGWENAGGDNEWFSSRVLVSGTFRLSALVKGDEEVVVSVVLREGEKQDRANPKSHTNLALGAVCVSKNGQEVCSVGALTFVRVPCIGGWLLLKPNGNKAKARQYCDQIAPMFEELP